MACSFPPVQAVTRSTHFVDPRHLDGFENFFSGMLGHIVKLGQFGDPTVEVSETNGARIDFGVRFDEFDCNIEGVCPLHVNALH